MILLNFIFQKSAAASVWEPAKQDVSGVFLDGGCVLRHIGGFLWVPSPVENFIHY